MRTLLIIENDIAELDTLLGIFHEWQTELHILTARDEASVRASFKSHHIDLLLCSTSMYCSDGEKLLVSMTRQFPFTPCIGFSAKGDTSSNSLLNNGVSFLHIKPYNTPLLFEQISELLDTEDNSSLKGVPTHTLLQMLETEERTCSVKIFGPNDTGFIFLLDGTPIAAETDRNTGETAFFEIISWEDTILEVLHFNGQRKKEIDRPLVALIMEGFKAGDKGNGPNNNNVIKEEEEPGLKKISTVGQRISLDIGSRIKVEIEHLEGTMDCAMVGMVPGEYLIVTCPEQISPLQSGLQINSHMLVKYLHMGKMCLFKSTIIMTIDHPQKLLFLEYPSVIHYHDLRRTKRAHIFIPCTLHYPEGEEFFGALVDMSSAGGLCQIKSKGNQQFPPVQIGGFVDIHCLLPGMKEEQLIHATIKNMKQNSVETRLGLEFYNMHNFLIDTINKFLFTMERL